MTASSAWRRWRRRVARKRARENALAVHRLREAAGWKGPLDPRCAVAFCDEIATTYWTVAVNDQFVPVLKVCGDHTNEGCEKLDILRDGGGTLVTGVWRSREVVL